MLGRFGVHLDPVHDALFLVAEHARDVPTGAPDVEDAAPWRDFADHPLVALAKVPRRFDETVVVEGGSCRHGSGRNVEEEVPVGAGETRCEDRASVGPGSDS